MALGASLVRPQLDDFHPPERPEAPRDVLGRDLGGEPADEEPHGLLPRWRPAAAGHRHSEPQPNQASGIADRLR